MDTKEIVIDTNLIAACGLYCGACGKYTSGKCPGCSENMKATWCKVRTCCKDTQIKSCADCNTFPSTKECNKMNNVISKIISLVFKSDRNACISKIKEVGYDQYAQEMGEKHMQSIKRN